MTQEDIRQKFIEFFKTKGHASVSSSSLIPTDPSVLFTTAGMQQFKPYYTGELDAEKDFKSINTVSIQKCMRTSDIDEVGDDSHLTFFEMLGNFSFGGYWKEEAIKLAYEFLTKEMNLKIDYVTIFKGDADIPKDTEAENIWRATDSNIKIVECGREDNFWGPTGNEGPCGPTTEIFINGLEVWNLVFNQYYSKNDSGKQNLTPLKTKGIDTGMGLERLAMIVQGANTIFETDLFKPAMDLMAQDVDSRIKRIVADHLRASLFIMADGVEPSNKERGYVLRKLIRRVVVLSHINNFDGGLKTELMHKFFDIYKNFYPKMDLEKIMLVFHQENEKFRTTLEKSLKELDKIKTINAKEAFRLYESFGLPYEIIKEVGGETAKDLSREDFDAEFKKHQQVSRTGSEKKFGGHGLILDTGELKAGDEKELIKVTRLHTATHLLQAALRQVLGKEIQQAGSDITHERLRFDFTFHRKMTNEELEKVESIANDVVANDMEVKKEEMPYDEAIKSGALAFFKLKYPEKVTIYTIEGFSKELCGGPHVTRTGEIGVIKIIKEESVSSGVRRIRATVR